MASSSTNAGTVQGHIDWLTALVVKAFDNPASITHSDDDFNIVTHDVEWWKDYIESFHD
jgi:hypothetical protein